MHAFVEFMVVMNGLKVIISLLAALCLSSNCQAETWKGLRTSGGGSQGWQALICENGSGWQSCELPVTVTMSASPTSLVANGQYSTITATVLDYYGIPVPNNVINWSATDGSISTGQTVTNASGMTSISLRSSWTLGGAAVYASTLEGDGSSGIWVPFVDSFVAYPSDYTGWTAYDPVYSCSAWSPDVSTVDSGSGFTQTASCYQNYYRYRQDRQQSVVTGAVTNVGGLAAEYTNNIVGISQWAIGTRYVAPPTPPTPPPAATTCSYVSGSTFFLTFDPNGGQSFKENGVTVSGPQTSYTHGREQWDGHIDYNGYRYTSGTYVTMTNQGRNFENYMFYLCKTPL
jgi:hypothetical protein